MVPCLNLPFEDFVGHLVTIEPLLNVLVEKLAVEPIVFGGDLSRPIIEPHYWGYLSEVVAGLQHSDCQVTRLPLIGSVIPASDLELADYYEV